MSSPTFAADALLEARSDDVARYRGQFMADVVPSFDRRERMKAEMRTQLRKEDQALEAFDHVRDDGFVLFMHGEACELSGLDPAQLDAALSVMCVWLVFDFETCELAIKAPSRNDREKLRDCFADIFVGVRDYFEQPCEHQEQATASDEPYPVAFHADPFRQDRIERVTVQRVAIRPKQPEVKRITIEFVDGLPLERARDLLAHHGIRLHHDAVEGAKLSFVFAGAGASRPRSIELERAHGRAKHLTARERSIHRYVKDWNLDADRRDPLVAAACCGSSD